MKHITIIDIARDAGVSKATVSRVLSNSHLVSEKTTEKVLSIIKKYSFSPNSLAQGLAGMPTKNIGVMICEFPNNFYIEIADGIDSVISVNNYSFQVTSSKWIPDRELQGIRSMIKNKVDGILITPMSHNLKTMELIKQSGIPFMLMNFISRDPEVSCVGCDNYKGGTLVAEHFNSMEQEQVIIVSVYDHPTVEERIAGFLDHLNTKKVRIVRYDNAKTYYDGYNLASIIAEDNAIRTTKTSLFVANDYTAIGIITRFVEIGISIPQQAAVVGYDDIHISALCRVPLTTVSQSAFDMGCLAATELMKIIKGEKTPPVRKIIEPRLVIRESTTPL